MTKKIYVRVAAAMGSICVLALMTAAPVTKENAEWKTRLTSEQYNVLREKGTEQPFTGKYNAEHAKGIYHCAACGSELYSSKTKFESGTGWPSFYQAIPGKVKTQDDGGRTEVVCASCGGHLGHVFNDGPKPTGKRYCMNSVALKLEKTP